ncbi:MAG: hypothetical protein WC069_05650 [Candidatus Shapirobacteria bacterium]
MKKTITFFTLITLFCLTPFFNTPVFAQIINPTFGNQQISSVDPQLYFNNVLSAIFSIFFIVGTIYFIWHIVFAGYHFIATEGDPKAYETAKNQITYSVVGIFVIFSVFAIIKLVGTVLGIAGLEDLTITWPTL